MSVIYESAYGSVADVEKKIQTTVQARENFAHALKGADPDGISEAAENYSQSVAWALLGEFMYKTGREVSYQEILDSIKLRLSLETMQRFDIYGETWSPAKMQKTYDVLDMLSKSNQYAGLNGVQNDRLEQQISSVGIEEVVAAARNPASSQSLGVLVEVVSPIQRDQIGIELDELDKLSG